MFFAMFCAQLDVTSQYFIYDPEYIYIYIYANIKHTFILKLWTKIK